MFEVLHGAAITSYFANVINIFHINVKLIIMGDDAVVMFDDMVRNA